MSCGFGRVPCLAVKDKQPSNMDTDNYRAPLDSASNVLPWRRWQRLLCHSVCPGQISACSWNTNVIFLLMMKIFLCPERTTCGFLCGPSFTHLQNGVTFTGSLTDWGTHRWPASCWMDGMAKKLFRECEAADEERTRYCRLCQQPTKYSQSNNCDCQNRGHRTFAAHLCLCRLKIWAYKINDGNLHLLHLRFQQVRWWQTNLWWDTRSGSQKRDPAQLSSPGRDPQGGEPAHGQETSARHLHFDLCCHFLQRWLPSECKRGFRHLCSIVFVTS